LYASYRQGNIWESSEIDRFYAFLHTVLQRPELARYVKNISVGPLSNDEPYHKDLSAELSELCRRRIYEICSGELAGSINDEARDAWIGYLEGPSPQAVLTVLLCSLQNLEFFFFEEGYEPVTFWLALQSAVSKLRAAQIAGSPPPNVPFTKLHSVDTYSREGKYGYMCFNEVCQFFNLPNMVTFEIALANG
jgi:hypothetical protein